MYATVEDMVERFTETQIMRLSDPSNHAAEAIDRDRVEVALRDATALINDYARRYYQVPLTPLSGDQLDDSIIRSTCQLARHDLAQSDHTEPSEEMEKAVKKVMGWLEAIGKRLIELNCVAAPTQNVDGGAGPRHSDRSDPLEADGLRG